MPKKTKKEKIIAEYRRRLQSVPMAQTPAVSVKTENISTPVQFVLPKVKEQQVSGASAISLNPNEFTIIKRDLVKTLILTAVIIVCEFLIAWRFR